MDGGFDLKYFQTYVEALLERVDADVEQDLQRLLLSPQLLVDLVQSLVQVDAQTRQNLFLRNLQCLRVPLAPTAQEKYRISVCLCTFER